MDQDRTPAGGSRTGITGIFLAFLLVGALAGLGIRSATKGEASEHRGPMTGPEGHAKAEPSPPEAPKGLLVDLGNVNCPIMGKPANGHTYSEWNGLRVGHCCVPCVADFLADPEKALDAAGIEWRKEAAAVARFEAAPPEHKKHVLAEIEKEFKVVRHPEDLR